MSSIGLVPIISPRTPWMNPQDGTPTPEFYKMFLQFMQAAGPDVTPILPPLPDGSFAQSDILALLAGNPSDPQPSTASDVSVQFDLQPRDELRPWDFVEYALALQTPPDSPFTSSSGVIDIVSNDAQLVISPAVGHVTAGLNFAIDWTFGANVTVNGAAGLNVAATVNGSVGSFNALVVAGECSIGYFDTHSATACSINGAGGLAVSNGLSCSTFACVTGNSSGAWTCGGAFIGSSTGTFAGNVTVSGSETITGFLVTNSNTISSINGSGGLSVAAALNCTSFASTVLNNSSNATIGGTAFCGGVKTTADCEVGANCYPTTESHDLGISGSHDWGNVYATGVFGPSDPRMKKAIDTVPGGMLDVIDAVRPITWEWQDTVRGAGTNWGFDAPSLAAEMEKVGPWAGHLVAKDRHYLNSAQIVPILWQAVRELSAKVAALEAH